MARRTRHLVGVHCGRSLDGVDACVISTTARADDILPAVAAAARVPLEEDLRDHLRDTLHRQRRQATLPAVADWRDSLAEHAADAARKALAHAGVAPTRVAAVGWTLEPDLEAADVGTGHLLARALDSPVVTAFAASDRAAGGDGRRIAAWADAVLLRHAELSRVLVRLGAATELTFLGASEQLNQLIAHDVGPGMLVLDACCQTEFGKEFDADGALAARGTPNGELVHELLSHPFHYEPIPRRIDWAHWDDRYEARLSVLAEKYRCRGADLLASAAEMIARGVEVEIGKHTERPHQVFLAGGGAANIHVAQRIRQLLSPSSTLPVEKLGVPAHAWAPCTAAVLAAARLDGLAVRSAAPCPCEPGIVVLPS